MTAAPPKASICMASYNHARYLPATVESALAQTSRDFEIVIVDDGSSDGSLALLRGYAERHPDIVRVVTHPGHVNRGMSRTFNLAIENARGRYIGWTGSDDLLHPRYLERMTDYLDRNPQLGLAYSETAFIDGEGNPIRQQPWVDINRFPEPLEYLLTENHIAAVSMMLRRECLDQAGGWFDERVVYSDWELWVRCCAHWKMGHLREHLASYRVHGGNVCRNVSLQTQYRRHKEVFAALHEKVPTLGGAFQRPRLRAMVDLQLAYYTFLTGDRAKAAPLVAEAFRTDPSLGPDAAFIVGWLHPRADSKALAPDGAETHRRFGEWFYRQLPEAAARALRSPANAALRLKSLALRQLKSAAWRARVSASAALRRTGLRGMIAGMRARKGRPAL